MSVDATHQAAQQLQHAAGFYESRTDLLAQVVPMVREALERGDGVVLAVQPSTADALREMMGGAREVTLLDHPDEPLGGCGQSLAVHRAQVFDALTASGPITAITEHDSRFDGPDGRFWTELDTAAQAAMAHLPVRLTCFFPLLPLHQVVLDGARRSHPLIRENGLVRPNPDHLPPGDVLAQIPIPSPVLLGAPHHQIEFGTERLAEIRALVERVLHDDRYTAEQVDDVVIAVNEVATNAVEHGRGPANLTLWVGPGYCVVEVHDRGVLADPLPGLTAPPPDHDHGWGLWVARRSCEYLRVWTDPAGTHVRIHITVQI
ncbi:MAG: sensor histidine kinase [Pseudonocardia sp.]|nr:sensor histidine kinase [Pseudonocardia sp.]